MELKYTRRALPYTIVREHKLAELRKSADIPDFKNCKEIVLICVEPFNAFYMTVTKNTTWESIKGACLRYLSLPDPDVTDIALGSEPAWDSTGPLSFVLDTRPDAPRPFNMLPNRAVLYVKLVYRKEIGWGLC